MHSVFTFQRSVGIGRAVESRVPEVNVVAAGKLSARGAYNCDTDEAIAAGFESSQALNVALDQPSFVYTDVVLSVEEAEAIEAVVVGSPYNGAALTFQPSIVNEYPPDTVSRWLVETCHCRRR